MTNLSRHARVVLLCLLTLPMIGGCGGKNEGRPGNATPGATYTGPRFLYNTVGSLSRLNNNQPQYVSGYGLVVGLDATGSSEVPQALRQWLINEMTKQGVGRQQYEEVLPLSPAQMLASPNTAVVRVEGIIPAGAVQGSRFDLLVSAADSSTTSLVGGRLYTCELSAGGSNPERFYLTPLALGRGAIYLGPSTNVERDVFELDENQRRALVVAGGEVLESRSFELVLNQPSRTRAGLIADRINERYPAAPSDERPTANALSPLVIKLHIPARYEEDPKGFIDLINHTFIDRAAGFVRLKADQLAEVLMDDPGQSASVIMAWKALGPNVSQVVRRYYANAENSAETQQTDEPQAQPTPLFIRLAALEAGAFVGDERASEFLLELAQHDDPSVRIRVAEALAHLSKSLYGDRALLGLLNDKIRSVRIAAYESLARKGSPLIERKVLRDRNGEIKMVIDRLPVRDPLIYITQKRYPRLVIFNPRLGFDVPTMAGVWGDRLMIRRTDESQGADFFFQYRDPKRENKVVTDRHQIDPTVVTLAYILAHRPSLEEPQDGYDLTYGQVADAIYQLAQAGAIDAEVEIDRSLMAQLLDRTRGENAAPGSDRPETAPPAPGNIPAETVTPAASR